MIPSRFEYVFLLVMLGLILVTIFHRPIRRELRKPAFWLGLTAFCIGCTLLELCALSQGWWTFNYIKILGIEIVGIPLEEYLLFAGFFVLVTSLSEITSDDVG